VQGAAWAGELVREAAAEVADTRRGNLEAAATAVARAFHQLASTAQAMVDAGDASELSPMEATSRENAALAARTHLEAAAAAIEAEQRAAATEALDGAAADLAAALEGLACDDVWACSTAAAAFVDGVCTAGAASTATATRVTAKLQPGTAKDKVVLKTRLAADAAAGNPSAIGLTLRLGRSAPYGDAHEFFEGTVAAGQIVDRKGDGSVFTWKAPSGSTGLASMKLKRDATGDLVAKFVVKGVQTEAARGARAMSLAVVLGSDPLVDDCAGAPALVCTTKGKAARCSSPS